LNGSVGFGNIDAYILEQK